MIQGKRIYLRHLTSHDAHRLFEYEVNNKQFFIPTSFTRTDSYYSLDRIRKNIDSYNKETEEKISYRFGIFLNSNHQLIGMIALNDVLWPLKTSYVGYSLDLKHTKHSPVFVDLNTALLLPFALYTKRALSH